MAAFHKQALLSGLALLALLGVAAAVPEPQVAPGNTKLRKLQQAVQPITKNPSETLPSYEALQAAKMCGSMYGCPQRKAAQAANGQLWMGFDSLWDAVGTNMTTQCALKSEECILTNINAILKQVFDMSAIKALTGRGCTFSGFRTWSDVAAVFTGLGWGTTGVQAMVDWNNFLTPGGAMALLGWAVDKQATMVQAQTCAWQSRPWAQFMVTLRDEVLALGRPGVFKDVQLFKDNMHCPMMGGGSQYQQSPALGNWISTSPCQLINTRINPDSACSGRMCSYFFDYTVQGIPAITCDCAKLPMWPADQPMTNTAGMGCKPNDLIQQTMTDIRNGGRPGQAYLNALLSNTAFTRLPWKLGSPLIFGCAQ